MARRPTVLDSALGVGDAGSADSDADWLGLPVDSLADGEGLALVALGVLVALGLLEAVDALLAADCFADGVGAGVGVGSAYAVIGAPIKPIASAAAAKPTSGRGDGADMTTPG